MKKEELMKYLDDVQGCLHGLEVTKEYLGQRFWVKQYLASLDMIQAEQEQLHFLKQLDIGEDGTVFAHYDNSKDMAFRDTHYGLSAVLKNAFCLSYLHSTENISGEEVVGELSITFEQLNDYINHASKVLRNMNYMEGDRLVPNAYQLEIYENPKNYSIIEFQGLSKWLPEQVLEDYYDLPGVTLHENSFYMQEVSVLFEENTSALTPREYEAFYGEGAQIALGLLPKQINRKVKKISNASSQK